MAATASILPIGNEKFKKPLSRTMGSRASFSGGVSVFSGIMGKLASWKEFVSGKDAEEGSVVAASPLETIAPALKECGSGRKYEASMVYEDDVGMGTANRPPMVINDDNGKARTMNDVVASSSEHRYAPSAPPPEQYHPIPDLTAGKGKACIEASSLDADDNGNYSAAAPPFWPDGYFGEATPAAIAPSDVEYPSLLDKDDDAVFERLRYRCFRANAGGGSSGEARTSSFKNVKDRGEASSTGSGNTAPKKMKKDSNFDTGVDCMAGAGGCIPFKCKFWMKRSKVDVYAIDG